MLRLIPRSVADILLIRRLRFLAGLPPTAEARWCRYSVGAKDHNQPAFKFVRGRGTARPFCNFANILSSPCRLYLLNLFAAAREFN